MNLDEYRRKRDFRRTAEPRGGQADGDSQWRFVIQKHQARALHYDLRLELDGVLKSWAVPKGPSLDPAQKRLAVRTEDHPLEYLDFEGVIPDGQYGAGAMLVWDLGTWECLGASAREDLERGELKFSLNGRKLQGRWMLLWTGRRVAEPGRRNQWLLFKERDAAVRTADDYDILTDLPASVLTGRTLEEVAANRPARRRASRVPPVPTNRAPVAAARPNQPPLAAIAGAARREMPEFPEPCLPTLTELPPQGDQWSHEIKYDGYRMLCRLQPGRIRFLSRNGKDWTSQAASLTAAVRRLPAREAWLDGEIAIVGDNGATDFQALQNVIHSGRTQRLKYFVFDLLYLDGYDLRGATLKDRRDLLQRLVENVELPPAPMDGAPPPEFPLIFSEGIQGDGPLVLRHACQLGVEGIVSKRLDSRHQAGRSDVWRKSKCLERREFIIGGFTDSAASRTGFGALVLGEPAAGGLLEYRGRVGTGFSEATLRELGDLLDQRRTDACPFRGSETLARKERETHWVRPDLIVEVEHGGCTGEGLIRFASYRGLRDDLTLADLPPREHTDAESPRPAPTNPPGPPPFSLPTAIRLTHPARVVYQHAGITKLGVAAYYAQAARFMLPHLEGRPLSLLRCPQGASGPCFFQKHPREAIPANVRRRVAIVAGKSETLLVADSQEALLALVQLNVLEFHVWSARADRLDRPDRLILDLDPDDSVAWSRVIEAARQVRELLHTAGLRAFVKTTGGKGLHVAAPLRRRHDWPEVKALADRVAAILAARWPARYTTSPAKAARRGKIFLDCNRNLRGATAAAPYSTRAREQAGVSTPLTWDELSGVASPTAFTIQNIQRRLDSLEEDPWAEMFAVRQSITQAGWRRLAEASD